MGYLPIKFKKKQGSVIAPSTSIKTGKTPSMPAPASNNRGPLSKEAKNSKMC